MKKNYYYFGAIFVMLLGISLIFFLTHQPDPKLNDVIISEKDSKTNGDQQKEATKTDQDEKQDDQTEEKPFSEMVVSAVEQTIQFFSNKTHVTAIGDSLTQGVGDSTAQGGYVGILERAINKDKKVVTFDNLGVRGNRSDQLLKRLDKPEVVSSIKRSDIVLITIGANDIMQVLKQNITNLKMEDFTKERAQYQERLHHIFSKIETINPKTKIYLLGFYNPFQKYFKDIKELGIIVENWNNTGKEIAASKKNVSFIPTKDLFDNTDENLFAEDNFHPNHLGYKRMAQRVLDFLTNEDERG
ncbi:MAG: SGNH/GDSL hydrolase family protein [Bacillota bacterium]|uniref:SGNH/GDSL hydrolase family protein n=1 Tax=Virgibacillus salarius TaxID=447199 RepID=A0A941DVW3_9BACI|nr:MULTISPECIES: SGNH/GDSL hydrolase family protein [Bacillaceae]NAZ09396.1 hypothetical protein [Agaribacter marinus]MBR7796686.1 SGNH/GDSL hydrolase family protein [Virgibacillus salarius]MCC2252364.1 SGNH/GDSL hydrolase family protein [Virgibacillus sp. AGTR]MDY7045859.1 SGNH/GDSL hydrolase family protein [Virgibacillus sp. M23]QRZ18614.1 SGNH/GDSL hydrolase family protein [Virgibacillus sp. AGTR]